ncbi:TetR/AcrR family transcriptional regulator [Streptomyces sp. NPDC044780]|uniref:TetR/AcrR family transcriptional regulator n=1 Tax=unclassified Streptomyces TaxID=2593676 RepID=UPI0033CE6407
MGRWEPNARGRLAQAALELYIEHGFEQTTVAKITERAGLTERTFFRHFADKREVLFAGTGRMLDHCVSAVAEAPDAATPMEMIAAALDAMATEFQGRAELIRQRQAVIDAHPELRERELIKLATWAAALTDAMRRRGVDELTAHLTAETGIAVLKVAFARWIAEAESGQRPLAQLIGECLDTLGTVTASR